MDNRFDSEIANQLKRGRRTMDNRFDSEIANQHCVHSQTSVIRNRFLLRLCVGLCLLAALSVPFVFPQIDLLISGLFYIQGQGFIYQHFWFIRMLHEIASIGGRALGVIVLGCLGVALIQRGMFLGFSRREWLFLVLNLLVGVGLVANVGFKDHWGRARPRDVVNFGGDKTFSAAQDPTSTGCEKNCSFVCGDGAFGFILPALAFVVAPQRRRRMFWGLGALGMCFAVGRIVGGAHFLSDVIAAAVMMLAFMTATSLALFGSVHTRMVWRDSVF